MTLPSLRAERIPLTEIDLNDATFRLTPMDAPPPPALVASIERVGILHPPIVQEKAQGSYRVVAGRQRLQALGKGRATCLCLILAANTPPLEALAIALEEALANGEPSPAEKAIFLDKAGRWLDQESLAGRFLPLLGLGVSTHTLGQVLGLLDLEEPLLLALHTGRLAEGVARQLVAMPFADRMALFEWIDLLQLSVGNQKKLVNGCLELARRRDTAIREILADQELGALLTNETANPPQKAAQLMSWLNGQRLPRLTEAEREFRSFSGKLALPKGVNLNHADAFERDNLTLTIDFADRSRLLAQWPALRAALTDDEK